jgi:hypothetical protein
MNERISFNSELANRVITNCSDPTMRTIFLCAVLLHIANGLQTSTILFQHYWDSRWMMSVSD